MIAVFRTTLQKSQHWLSDLSDALDVSENEAYQALRAVLHALRDRLPETEAVHLAAQLPMLLRGLFYESWRPTRTPLRARAAESFFQMVRDVDPRAPILLDTERVVRGVFRVMDTHVGGGEMRQIREALPADIRRAIDYDAPALPLHESRRAPVKARPVSPSRKRRRSAGAAEVRR